MICGEEDIHKRSSNLLASLPREIDIRVVMPPVHEVIAFEHYYLKVTVDSITKV